MSPIQKFQENDAEKPNVSLCGYIAAFSRILHYFILAIISVIAIYGFIAIERFEKSIQTLETQLDEMNIFHDKLMENINKMMLIAGNLNSSTSIEKELVQKSSQMTVIKAAYTAIEKIKNGQDFSAELDIINKYEGSSLVNERLGDLYKLSKHTLQSNSEIVSTLSTFSLNLSGNVVMLKDHNDIPKKFVEVDLFKNTIKVQEIKELEFKHSLESAIKDMRKDDLTGAIEYLKPIAEKYTELEPTIQMLQIKVNSKELIEQIIKQIVNDAN